MEAVHFKEWVDLTDTDIKENELLVPPVPQFQALYQLQQSKCAVAIVSLQKIALNETLWESWSKYAKKHSWEIWRRDYSLNELVRNVESVPTVAGGDLVFVNPVHLTKICLKHKMHSYNLQDLVLTPPTTNPLLFQDIYGSCI